MRRQSLVLYQITLNKESRWIWPIPDLVVWPARLGKTSIATAFLRYWFNKFVTAVTKKSRFSVPKIPTPGQLINITTEKLSPEAQASSRVPSTHAEIAGRTVDSASEFRPAKTWTCEPMKVFTDCHARSWISWQQMAAVEWFYLKCVSLLTNKNHWHGNPKLFLWKITRDHFY